MIALVGDGAMQMNGMAELITVAKYWKQWSSPRFVVVVLNDRDRNQVTREQRAQAGDPKFMGSQSIPDVSYCRFAELIGLKGMFVDNPTMSAACGTRLWRPICRWWWRPIRILTCRRCRRTSRLHRRVPWPARCTANRSAAE